MHQHYDDDGSPPAGRSHFRYPLMNRPTLSNDARWSLWFLAKYVVPALFVAGASAWGLATRTFVQQDDYNLQRQKDQEVMRYVCGWMARHDTVAAYYQPPECRTPPSRNE